MASVAELINSLCKKANVNPEEFQKVVEANEALKTIQVPDQTKNLLENSLLTVDQAKQNADVKKHFKGTLLSTIDDKINEAIDEAELTDELKTEILGETSSYERIKKLGKAIKQLEAQKITAVSGDKKALADQISSLNNAIVNERKKFEAQLASKDSEYQSALKDMTIQQHLANYTYTDAFPKPVALETALSLLRKQMIADGAEAVLHNGQIKLVSAKDKDLPFSINNEEVGFDSYTAKLVADNKLLKTNPGNGTPSPQQHNTYQPNPADPNAAQKANALDILKQTKADITPSN